MKMGNGSRGKQRVRKFELTGTDEILKKRKKSLKNKRQYMKLWFVTVS